MMKLMTAMGILFLLVCQTSWAEEMRVPQPYELTPRGVIAGAATEAYKEALEHCAETLESAHGPKFVACLKQRLRSETERLAGTYNSTTTLLKSTADRLATLRNAQGAWTKFRDENCTFARSVAPTEIADESYYDCLLRATIDRRVELNSLVGD